jgi:hypothetical protein
VDEGQDPGRGLRPLRDERAGASPEPEERFLNGVLGERLVAKDAVREPIRGPADAVVELRERGLVGSRDERDERLVGEMSEVTSAHRHG